MNGMVSVTKTACVIKDVTSPAAGKGPEAGTETVETLTGSGSVTVT